MSFNNRFKIPNQEKWIHTVRICAQRLMCVLLISLSEQSLKSQILPHTWLWLMHVCLALSSQTLLFKDDQDLEIQGNNIFKFGKVREIFCYRNDIASYVRADLVVAGNQTVASKNVALTQIIQSQYNKAIKTQFLLQLLACLIILENRRHTSMYLLSSPYLDFDSSKVHPEPVTQLTRRLRHPQACLDTFI